MPASKLSTVCEHYVRGKLVSVTLMAAHAGEKPKHITSRKELAAWNAKRTKQKYV